MRTTPQPSHLEAAGSELEEVVLALVTQIARELLPQHAAPVSLDCSLERDLGVDSLARIELLRRVEARFEVDLPQRIAISADTPRALVEAIREARGGHPVERALESVSRALSRDAVSGAPEQAATIVDVLRWHAAHQPDTPYVHLLVDEETEELTYAQLLRGAEGVAAGLVERGLAWGETVGLMLPSSLDFFTVFYGVLLAGGIPVPIYPPHAMSLIEEHLRRQARILENAQARFLVTVSEARRLGALLEALLPDLRGVVIPEELSLPGQAPPVVLLEPEHTALLQYTSGSTGDPKGVILTHANLMASVRVMGEAIEATSKDVFVSWLPLYHDMGLIGACLGTLYYGCLLVLMSPLAFVTRPRRWLRAIHRYRGTISAAPNFAYAICASKLSDEDLEGLDLSCWRAAFNGAEPVNPDTIRRFSERLEPYGLSPESMLPVYGLAEASLGLTFPQRGRTPKIDRVQRSTLRDLGRAQPASETDEAQRFVCCGRPLRGHEVRVVDSAGRELGEREEGRIEFRGPAASQGYYRNPTASAALFKNGWLDSGDNGYLAQGELYVTGRVKDLIIKAGHNIYPEELELAVGDLPGVRKGCVAVFGVYDEGTRTEKIVVVAESRETDAARKAALGDDVRRLAAEVLGVPVDDVVIALPHTVRKTSSGKIRRSSCRELYEAGELVRRRAVSWQLLRLGASGVWARTRRLARTTRAHLHALRFWLFFGLAVPVIWLGAVLLPLRSWGRWFVRLSLRLTLWLMGVPLKVEGRLPRDAGPLVVVSNHASYLDGLVLAATLPTRCTFVIKRELATSALGLPLRRLGHQWAERFDAEQSLKDVESVANAVQAGEWPVFFSEGTFARAAGLRPFHMGAFHVATETRAPVLPLAIRGTRSVLRPEQWYPRQGEVEVTLYPPILPEGEGWAETLRLRDAARARILTGCGEPDLSEEVIQPPRPSSRPSLSSS